MAAIIRSRFNATTIKTISLVKEKLSTWWLLFAFSSMVAARSVEGIPIAKIKESIICCPQEQITLDGWASIDPAGEVVLWMWDITGDGQADTSCVSGFLSLTAPLKYGPFLVILWVQDNSGNVSLPDSTVVHVLQSRPVIKMPADTAVKVGVRLQYEPQVITTCGGIVRYEWDFNDDGIFEYHSVEHGRTSRVYFKQGTFKARFKVTDNFGNQTEAIRTVRVLGEFK